MWTRRRFLERVGGGVGVAATLGVGGMECVLAAGQAVRGRRPQEVAADEDCWREIQEADIRKFEDVGTRTQANRVVMAEALTFNEGIGIERKSARLRYLKDRWANRLKANPRVTFLTSLDPAESCAIASINIAGVDMPKMAATLHDEHGIVVSHLKHERFECFRIVPNIHMTMGEIDYFSDAMEEVIKKTASLAS